MAKKLYKLKLTWGKINPKTTAMIASIVLVVIGMWLMIDKWFIKAFTYNYKKIFGSEADAVDAIVNHDWVGFLILVVGLITFFKNK